ncbi:MAG: hypothetical protein V4732_12745 [Pseudomonadota bacterium]
MRKKLFILSGLLLLQSSPQIFASDLGINVILSGQVAPGVYGQVEVGNTPRPRVVYEQPVVIVTDRQHVRAEPIYLHVPPGHAKNWSKHCSAYNACGRQVYFVKSEEYEPEYQHRENHHDAGHKGKDKHHGKKHDKHK